LLGLRDRALALLARFRAAFPEEDAQWAKVQKGGARAAEDEDAKD